MPSILGADSSENERQKGSSEAPNEHTQRAVEYVRRLQRDGRLLVWRLARRADRTLSPAGLTGAPASAALSGRLLADPAALAAEPSEVAALASRVDTLSRCRAREVAASAAAPRRALTPLRAKFASARKPPGRTASPGR